jgi:transglutaminase-like putative cysteine protease
MRPALCLLALLNVLTIVPALQTLRTPAMQGPELSSQHSEAFHFLKQHMPAADRHKVSDEFLHEHVRLALRARGANSWAAAVPWPVFLNEVLPYRNLDEPIDQWRADFMERFSPMVTSASDILEAAAILNQQIWKIWGIYFKADQAPEILSPSQVIAAGYGSCSALSIFYVDACRAVGIPARVAGALGRGSCGRHQQQQLVSSNLS